ncbi:2-C-methyl-D-erythritol 4-phosphate cytidylyltransferase [Fervidobacterium changbaicum]|uniref:2-C-methyl-D-erythritol 4-phosphate cytidylyltransferase n=1 Tax=Fervidobacterium changbaicum TaxID=310769 RepID=A0AAE5XC40_9BACT|nr:IspD/TarI family cytidylyltransferase [Fervidobacterium changbaicum]QAV34005.1 2-C-methyl-D-erythritol 4-phosphate cytidylyltransferase [Fervidobacterium changbaicum]SDH79398.1 2-C-methyl-D-erythritol 4-phosphate cytidylyltransferase [Fervidobacterium changbaicum]
MSQKEKVFALLMFGGIGSRFGWDKPKQFYVIDEIRNKTLLEFVVEKFVNFKLFDRIIIVCPENYLSESKTLLSDYINLVDFVTGGGTREHSVWNGLNFLKDLAGQEDIVVIHDGARPLVSKKIVQQNIEAASGYGAVVTAINTTETVSYSEDGSKVDEIIPRSKVFIHQTPQSFKYHLIKSAMESQLDSLHLFTDEASIVLNAGHDVYYVTGSRLNLKVTTMEDMIFLKRHLEDDSLI